MRFDDVADCNRVYVADKASLSSPLTPVHYHGQPVECSWTIDGGTPHVTLISSSVLSENIIICCGMTKIKTTSRWRSGDFGVLHPNEVILRRALLVRRWVTVRGYAVLLWNRSPRRTQPPILSEVGMSACQSAMMLCGKEINTGMTHSTCVPRGYHIHCMGSR